LNWLFERAPFPVLSGLARNASAEAWALREQALRRGWLDRVLPGLAGLGCERAWNARERGIRAGLHGPGARSLSGLACERAEATREYLFPLARLEVLASTRGLDSPFARRARELLEGAGLPVDYGESEAGHTIAPSDARRAVAWLAQTLPTQR